MPCWRPCCPSWKATGPDPSVPAAILWIALLLALSGCVAPLPAEEVAPAPPIPLGAPASMGAVEKALPAEAVVPGDPAPPPAAASRPGHAGAEPIPEILIAATGLSGFWAVRASSSIDIEVGLLSGVRIRVSGNEQDRDICRLRQSEGKLRATCIAGFAPTAEGSLDDETIALRWWLGPATVIFHGRWDQRSEIAGALTGGVAGLSVTGEVPAALRKLRSPEAASPLSAALMMTVFEDLRRGALSDGPYDGLAAKRLQPAFSWAGAKDVSHHLTYLGRIHIRWHRWQAETVQDVYDVRGPADRSLCRIGLDGQGRVIDFACQSVPD